MVKKLKKVARKAKSKSNYGKSNKMQQIKANRKQ